MDQFSDDLPPPYSASVSSSIDHSFSQRIEAPSSQSSLFSAHLASIRSQISAEQAARTSARDERDSFVLALTIPCIEELLSSIGGIHPPPRLVEATLVPDAATGVEWQFSDENEKRHGEFRKLIRVRQVPKLSSKNKGLEAARDKGRAASSAYETNESDSRVDAHLWWEDEDMARRLAKHLQPPRTSANEGLVTPTHGDAQSRGSKKGTRWGLFKNADKPAEAKASILQATPFASTSSSATGQQGSGVTMSVRAEEVTFRKENEFGLWESNTGWGLVIRVRIQAV